MIALRHALKVFLLIIIFGAKRVGTAASFRIFRTRLRGSIKYALNAECNTALVTGLGPSAKPPFDGPLDQ
jgi:hypothetical protein